MKIKSIAIFIILFVANTVHHAYSSDEPSNIIIIVKDQIHYSHVTEGPQKEHVDNFISENAKQCNLLGLPIKQNKKDLVVLQNVLCKHNGKIIDLIDQGLVYKVIPIKVPRYLPANYFFDGDKKRDLINIMLDGTCYSAEVFWQDFVDRDDRRELAMRAGDLLCLVADYAKSNKMEEENKKIIENACSKIVAFCGILVAANVLYLIMSYFRYLS